jgi:hypothetical protein
MNLGALSSYVFNDPQISQQAIPGLSGVAGSLGYDTAAELNHFHSSLQIYGQAASSSEMVRKSTTPIVVTGGNGVFGTELEVHDGTVIQGGAAGQFFDMNTMFVTAVGTTNRVTILEFYANASAAGIAATTQAAGDTLTKAGHGLANGTRIQLDTIVTSTGINFYTIYYVVSTAANTFQLSLTLGGGAVDIATGDGTCNYHVITQTLITETIVSRAAATIDSLPIPMQMPRQPCNTRVSCRANANGGTNAISFFLGLHAYPS